MTDTFDIYTDAAYDTANRWYHSVDGQLSVNGIVECSVCYKEAPMLHECMICRTPMHFTCGVEDECNNCIEDRGRIGQRIVHAIHKASAEVSTTWYTDVCMKGADADGNEGWIIYSHDYVTRDPVFIAMPSTYEQACRMVVAHNQLQTAMTV